MTRFNVKKNYEKSLSGGKSFKIDPETKLYLQVCSSMLQPTYYVPDTNDQLNSIKSTIRSLDPEFVAKMAVYAREQMYLRTIPLVLTVELAKIHSGDNLIRKVVNRVVSRADEITELMAYYVKANNITPKWVNKTDSHKVEKVFYKVSNQLRKGLADIFESGKFDEYQFAKYNRKGLFTLADILRLIHPKPQTAEQSALFEKILTDTLETPYTWETQLSKAGQEGLSKKKTWEELILSGRLGYMAMLRNLRNFLKEDIHEGVLSRVCKEIANPKNVRRSKQLPFRFLSAYRALVGMPRPNWGHWDTRDRDGFEVKIEDVRVQALIRALESAVKISVENIPMFDNEQVLLASDVSGSMQTGVSERSHVQLYDIGALLMFLVHLKTPHAITGIFGNEWKPIQFKSENVLEATQELHNREGEVGYSTNGYKVIKWALEKNIAFDRVMIFTDNQLYGNDIDGRGVNRFWNQYHAKYPNSRLYLFNLNGYGQVPLNLQKDSVACISGWSDKIFDILNNVENADSALKAIHDVEL